MTTTKAVSFFIRMLGVTVLLCVLMSTQGSVSNVLAGTDTWTTSGPAGGHITALAVDPATPATVYAGTAESGVYKSMDAGASWAWSGTGLPNTYIRSLVIDPQNATTIYAGTSSGVFRSLDGGANWSRSNTGPTNPSIQALVIDPKTPSTIYAGGYGGVSKSDNGGDSWLPVNNGLTETYVSLLAIDWIQPDTVYAGTHSGLFRSTDRGNSWLPINLGPGSPYISSVATDPMTACTLYAGGYNNILFKSTDCGDHWELISFELMYYSIRFLVIDPLTPTTLYAGTYNGVYKSVDGGSSWDLFNDGMTEDPRIEALAINPFETFTLYAGTWNAGGVFKSVDSGEHWRLSNRGLANTTVYDLAIDPLTPSTLYAGTYFSGVFKSMNGGEDWSSANNGLSNTDVRVLTIDPVHPSTLYAVTYDGVFKSEDGAGSWFPINTGLTDTSVDILVVDPTAPLTLFAGTSGGGVFRSTDGGNSWDPINNGLTNLDVASMAIDPMTPSTLYAGTYGGVFQSINGGGNWFPVNNGMYMREILTLAIDPMTPSTLYAGGYGGLFKSTDSGRNWFPLYNSDLPVYYVLDLAIDPWQPDTVYAATYNGVFISTNGGEDWNAMNSGLTNLQVNDLAVDPLTSTNLYAGTDGAGVAKYSSSAISCQVSAGQVVINEILPSPSNGGTEWVELYNTTDHPLNLGYCLVDDAADAGSPPQQIPAATIIPAHGFWTLDQTNSFDDTGDEVRLLKEDAITLLDSFTFGNTAPGFSWIRIPDGGDWAGTAIASPTKRLTNTLPFYPKVFSSLRSDANPTNADSVNFTVTFSKVVTGVNLVAPFADFSLTTSGVSGAHISAVSGSGTTYRVTVSTGLADGTIRLNILDDDTIRDAGNQPLGGVGKRNGDFTLGQTYMIDKTVSFADVSMTDPYWQDIEILYANNLTGGCSTNPLKFCPGQIMNRAQSAAFMLRGNFGSGYVPPVPQHIFQDDWSKGPWAESWAEGMIGQGFSAGCLTHPLKYCPWDQIPREQAAIFSLKLKYGKQYTPPPATGTLFADMTNPSYYATAWAEQAYLKGLIPNCGMSGSKPKICPKELVSRGLAAYMIVRARNLKMP